MNATATATPTSATTPVDGPDDASPRCRNGGATRRMTFEDLVIEHCGDVLTPRGWTALQSRWAVELMGRGDVPDGPLLELCAGVGHIGLAAAAATSRRLVQVDEDAEACTWARHNARRNGLADLVEVRCGDMGTEVHRDELFAVVLADPPYVPSDQIDDHPDDPVSAIDGGDDGLELACRALVLATRHCAPGGAVLVQARGGEQLDTIATALPASRLGWALTEVRAVDPERAVGCWRRQT